MTPSDWTLMVIEAAGEKTLQPVQLQKALFLIERNLGTQERGTSNFYSFTPYDYGPFCADVYRDAEALEARGLVQIIRARYKRYSITESGAARAAEVMQDLPVAARQYLTRVVDFVTSLSFNELVSAIYREYPEMRANSVFQG